MIIVETCRVSLTSVASSLPRLTLYTSGRSGNQQWNPTARTNFRRIWIKHKRVFCSSGLTANGQNCQHGELLFDSL